MKRLIPAIAVILGSALTAWSSSPAPIVTLRAIHALTNAEAGQAIPVAFEAAVGYSRGYSNLLYVQDGDVAIYVRPANHSTLAPGDRVSIQGITQQSFRPIVRSTSVTVLRHGTPPKPILSTFPELIRAEHDCMLVTVRATIRAADIVTRADTSVRSARLQLLTDGGHIEANVDSDDEGALKDMMDAAVEITGVAAGKFDGKMQQTGVVLYVSSLANVKILKRANANPWSLPLTPLDNVLAHYYVSDLTPRIRVHGTITYYEPGATIVLQDGLKSLMIATHTRDPLQIGDQADVTGFPIAHDRLLMLTDGESKDSHVYAPVTPQPATWHQLAFWGANTAVGREDDLVSIEGQVVAEVREALQDEYVVVSDGRLFSAIHRHPPIAEKPSSMMEIPIGSKVRVTGICTVADANSTGPGAEVPFNILMRSLSDIKVLSGPSPVNIRNMFLLVGLLLAAVAIACARGWMLERKLRRQTAAMSARTEAEAELELRRSRILEDINGSRPLTEIIEEIAELISFKLQGAPCWCQIAGGGRIGVCPMDLTAVRIVRQEIATRSGPPLGVVLAGLDLLAKPSGLESEALSMAAGLAALAIETRKLYSDLLHRSEFDLLTDIHNRFSLGKRLDNQIEEARQSAGIFGLIYIDLDGFKQVNDLYGHHIGDLYLQEVTRRMKEQLRSHDLLARLGGDEFAVLLPQVRNRSRVEEIAQRLEDCFADPLILEGNALQGSASFGIALYPEDGATGDGLLNAADAAMYAVKNSKRQVASILAQK